jgi:hypothetical protein
MKNLLKIIQSTLFLKKRREKAKPYPETFKIVQPKVHAKDYGEWLKYIYQQRNRPYRRGL